MALGEPDRKPDTEHAHQVIRTDVGAENRGGNTPPTNAPPGEKVVFGGAFATACPETRAQDDEERTEENDDIESRENDQDLLARRASGRARDEAFRAKRSIGRPLRFRSRPNERSRSLTESATKLSRLSIGNRPRVTFGLIEDRPEEDSQSFMVVEREDLGDVLVGPNDHQCACVPVDAAAIEDIVGRIGTEGFS